MRRLLFKVLVTLLAALMGVGLILYQQKEVREGFEMAQRLDARLQALHSEVIALQSSLLEANYFLYYNNDVIYQRIEKIKKQIADLLAAPHIRGKFHPETYRLLAELQRDFAEMTRHVDEFLTLNASIKNSSIYLPTLALKAYRIFDMQKPKEREIILTLSRINASLFLAKNALDESFIPELESYEKRLAKLAPYADTKAKKRLVATTMNHLKLFVDLFPRFHLQLENVLRPTVKEDVERAMKRFGEESAKEMSKVTRIGELLLLFYLATLAVVLYFVFHSEREYLRLKKTQKELEKSLHTDPLTGLENRQAYVESLQRLEKPALVLVNIDRFKHINEFYGSEVGDHLLQAVASTLRRIVAEEEPEAEVFRMGGDDFGILFECDERDRLEELVKKVLRRFDEETFIVDNLAIDISVSIGASMGRKLFETADMALKSVKSSRRRRYAIYDPSLDVSETIAGNIHALRQLKKAIAEDAVVPWFQPIVDIAGGEVREYEALARLQAGEGEVVTPYFFIEAAKQAKLSGVITARILARTLEMAEKTGRNFSVNLSAEDIVGEFDRGQIFDLLEAHPEAAKHIVFEILESEEIEDYDLVSDFIREAKRHGCRISIDDFGSGYSNFEKLLQLEIDILKIDGSLIRNVDHDRHAELVVRTIVEFAKGAGLSTVAEFVHSEAVYKKVAELGIDCAQGYYLGAPRPAHETFGSL